MTTGKQSMPMAGIAAQMEPAEDRPEVHYPDADTVDPQALIWARQTGRYLRSVYQQVLVELAFYARKGGDGIVWPSQQTIADNIGKSRSLVNGALQGLEALGVIRSSIRHEVEGHHKQYQLMGHFNGWEPMLQEVQERRPVFLILADRIAAKDAEIEDLKHQLAEARRTSPEGVPVGANVLTHDIRSQEGESPIDGGPGANVLTEDIRPEGRTEGSSEADIEAWVEREWDWIKQSKENPQGWYSGKERFIEWLKAHPEDFQRQAALVEARKLAAKGARARPMTPHERRIAQDKRIPLRDIEVI